MSKNFKKYFKKHLHFDEITLWLKKFLLYFTKPKNLNPNNL